MFLNCYGYIIMKKLQVNDPVIVIAWKYKGKNSSITQINEDKVWLKDINEVKKAVKWKWFIKKHLPINISNIMYYDETTKKPSKIKIDVNKEWKKVRTLKKTNKEIK